MSSSATGGRPVREVMSGRPICAGLATTVGELAEMLETNGISGVPVIDANERVVGVVSKTDLIRRCVQGPLGLRPTSSEERAAEGLGGGAAHDAEVLGAVEDLMTVDPVTAMQDEPVGVVARRMADERVHRVVVVDEAGRATGMVTTLDLLGVFPE